MTFLSISEYPNFEPTVDDQKWFKILIFEYNRQSQSKKY